MSLGRVLKGLIVSFLIFKNLLFQTRRWQKKCRHRRLEMLQSRVIIRRRIWWSILFKTHLPTAVILQTQISSSHQLQSTKSTLRTSNKRKASIFKIQIIRSTNNLSTPGVVWDTKTKILICNMIKITLLRQLLRTSRHVRNSFSREVVRNRETHILGNRKRTWVKFPLLRFLNKIWIRVLVWEIRRVFRVFSMNSILERMRWILEGHIMQRLILRIFRRNRLIDHNCSNFYSETNFFRSDI